MRAGDGAVGMRYLVGWRREPSQRRASFVRLYVCCTDGVSRRHEPPTDALTRAATRIALGYAVACTSTSV